MAIKLDEVPEGLIQAVKDGNMIPLIGAGMSKLAKTSSGDAFPTWTELLKIMSNEAKSNGYIRSNEYKEINGLVEKGKKFLMVTQALKEAYPMEEYARTLQRLFNPPDAVPSPTHRALFKLKTALILTTNYDTLLEDAYAKQYRKAPDAWCFFNAPLVQHFLQSYARGRDRPVIFKLHGSISSIQDMILSESDYRRILYREPGYRAVLSALFVTKVILMIGFSFSDPEIFRLKESMRDAMKSTSPSGMDYILLPKDEAGKVEKKRLRDDFGLFVIEYTPTKNHSEIKKLIEYLVAKANESEDSAEDLIWRA